jgi:hypothetical protein
MALTRTGVSEEYIVSIIRMKRISYVRLVTFEVVFSSLILLTECAVLTVMIEVIQEPHSVTSQKAAFLIVTAVKT